MAILEVEDGISVVACLDDKAMVEYPIVGDIKTNAETSVRNRSRTKGVYIESTDDAEFSLKLGVMPPYQMDSAKLAFEITVDGKNVGTHLCHRPDFNRNDGHWEKIVEGQEIVLGRNKAKVRKFKFAAIVITDDHDKEKIKTERRRLQGLGDIVVTVYRDTYGKNVKPDAPVNISSAVKEMDEETMKGEPVLHGVAFTRGESIKRPRKWKTEHKDGPEHPVAIFVFKYRSNAALKQLHILPNSRPLTPEPESPAKLPTTPPPKSLLASLGLNGAQRAGIEALMFLLQPAAANVPQRPVKPEPEHLGSSGIKREYDLHGDELAVTGASAVKKPRGFEPGEMIDLLVDDDDDDDDDGDNDTNSLFV